MNREQRIIRTSLLGIGANLLLVAFKAVVGLSANSIAVIMDALNNLSDALSSVITIVGTKLAGRRPDKKHPYGYGRVEYLTGMLIAMLVLAAGLTALKESVVKIFRPEETEYTALSLAVIAAAVLAKLLMGRYVKRVGEKIDSQALTASGADALFDAVLSLGTFAAALLSMSLGWKLEGVLGAVISLFIVKAGVEMLLDTLNSITGVRADSELTKSLRETILTYPQVRGVYDLSLHSYGPTKLIGSAHVELEDEATAREIHRLSRRIAAEVYERYGIVLTLGVYASNDSGEESRRLHRLVEETVARHPEVLQMHGFYLDREEKHVMFDVVLDFSADEKALYAQLRSELQEQEPDYRFDIVLDTDVSD